MLIDFTEFTSTANSKSPEEVFLALETIAQHEVGAIIFTCSTFNAATRQAKRVYTNLPNVYPLSGLKEITANRWSRHVLDESKDFVANTLKDLEDIFPDHELIGSLGCGSVINMPVKLSGHFLGTINALNPPGYFDVGKVAAFRQLQVAGIVAFCSLLEESNS